MKQIKVTGNCCVALGIDAKVTPSGICLNSDIIPLEEKLRDPHNPINKCVFCRNGDCYFDGECENKKITKV